MTDDSVHGPIDFVLLEFTGGSDLGPTATALTDLVERGTIRLYDVAAIRKAADGTFELVDIEASGEAEYFLSGARSGVLGDDDLQAASDVMVAGTTALLLMYENTWAIPFVDAALHAGGTMVAAKRIPAEDVIVALDQLDSND